jgi:hypothetical protein
VSFRYLRDVVVCLNSGSPNRNISGVRTGKCEDLCEVKWSGRKFKWG